MYVLLVYGISTKFVTIHTYATIYSQHLKVEKLLCPNVMPEKLNEICNVKCFEVKHTYAVPF